MFELFFVGEKRMAKILTLLGTRPEFIRLSLIIPKLDDICGNNHKIVHTGQNYDNNLDNIFFKELGLRKPDYHINSKTASFSEQISLIFQGVENILANFHPNKMLILGDTNSSLAAIIAERAGIPVYHMEAGNRCFDKKVPEEINRKIIDSISSFNIPYTFSSRENLLREGLARNKIFVSGNPIYEVLNYYQEKIDHSPMLEKYKLIKNQYVIATAHRAENVDDPHRLGEIFLALDAIAEKYNMPVIFSCHPRTQNKISLFNIKIRNPLIRISKPFGFFDFVKLEKYAACAITDSGTVQEECCLLRVPTVTIRDSTERPETINCGSNIISGLSSRDIITCFDVMIKSKRDWDDPEGYHVLDVSDKIVKMLLGVHQNVS